MAESRAVTHWTTDVYRTNGRLLYDVERALFQNDVLTRYEVETLASFADLLGVDVQSPVLDLACGPGRHSWALSDRGLSVTGVDFSESLLAIARRPAFLEDERARTPRFACADMRRLPVADGSFRTVVVLGNSFGYFSDGENLEVLREAHRVLVDGGLLCLEVTHKSVYLDGFHPFESETIRGGALGPLESKWWKWWDADGSRLRTWERHHEAASGAVLYQGGYDVRLYETEELVGLLRDVGFRRTACRAGRPEELELADGLGETLGSMAAVLFMGAVK